LMKRAVVLFMHFPILELKAIKVLGKTEDYLKNYFINKYGAIEDVDFSDLLSNK